LGFKATTRTCFRAKAENGAGGLFVGGEQMGPRDTSAIGDGDQLVFPQLGQGIHVGLGHEAVQVSALLEFKFAEEAHGGAGGLLLEEVGIHPRNAGQDIIAIAGESEHGFPLRFRAVKIAVDVFVQGFDRVHR